MAEENPEEPEQKEAEGPEETKVGCFNTCCRWIGCCDVTSGEEVPNLRQGVLKKRACTDCPWLILLFAFTAFCVVYIWLPVINESDLDRFTGASDYLLNTCGTGDFEDYPVAAWPDLMQFNVKICVESCDITETDPSSFGAAYTGTAGAGSTYDYSIDGYVSSKQVFWCVPEFDGEIYDIWYAQYEDYQIVRWINDLYNNYEIALYALPCTFVFLLMYFVFVRCFLKCLIRILFFVIIIATAFVSYTFMQPGLEHDSESYYTGVAIMIMGIVFWCSMMCCWKQLMEVCDVMKKASEALIMMPLVNFIPLLTFPFVAGVVFAWFFLTSLMFSSEEDTSLVVMPSSTYIDQSLASYYSVYETAIPVYKEINYDTNIQHYFWVHLFWMLWSLVFIEYFNFVVIASCVADWFLDKELVDNPETGEEEKSGCCGGNCMRIFWAICRTIRYHLGTIAFASALIAAIQLLEYGIMYAQKSIADSDNPFAKTALKILLGIVKCLECIINRCNKNTLVVTAVLGSPFCGGCGKSLSLLFKNMSLMTMGTSMIVLLTYLANICVAMLSTGIAIYLHVGTLTTAEMEENMESLFLPALTGFVISFLVGKVLLSVWDAAATSILVCHALLHEYYPSEFGKHLGSKAKKKSKKEGEKSNSKLDGDDDDIEEGIEMAEETA